MPAVARRKHTITEPRSVVWPFGEHLTARLTFYPPHLSQARHEHEHAQFSLVLAGDFEDAIGRSEAALFSGSYVRRPVGAAHAVRYGRSGALILSVESCAPPVEAQNAIPSDLHPKLVELINRTGPATSQTSNVQWLPEARARLSRGNDRIGAISRELGIHRVQFARSFRHAYGLSPSAFRLRSMLARALSLSLAHDVPFSYAALDAGFADQAHFSRAARALCGLSAKQLRMLLSTP